MSILRKPKKHTYKMLILSVLRIHNRRKWDRLIVNILTIPKRHTGNRLILYYRSLLQNLVSLIGLFCKRDLCVDMNVQCAKPYPRDIRAID